MILLVLFLAVPTYADQASDAVLQSKIDQLFIVGFRGASFDTAPEVQKILAETNVGGVILFDYDTPTKVYDRNIKTKAQTIRLIADLQSHAKTPLFVSIDEEGGQGQSFEESTRIYPNTFCFEAFFKN